MDLLFCMSLTALELLAAQSFHERVPDRTEAIILFLCQYLPLKIYRIFLYPHYFSPLRHLPGPKNNHFLFGQLLNIARAPTPTTLYVEWMKEHPEAPFIRYLGLLNNECLLPNSVAAHKSVLYHNCYNFVKPNWFVRLTKEVAGHGVILMEGNEHKAHRRMLNNSFTLNSIRKIEPTFKEKAKNICELFEKKIDSNDGKTGTFNCIDTFMKAILDIMGIVVLGVNLDYVKPGDDFGAEDEHVGEKSSAFERGCTFHEAYEVFFSPSLMGKVMMFANAIAPARWIPVKANREFMYAMGWLNSVLRNLIRDRYKTVGEAKAAGTYESKNSRDLTTFIVEDIPKEKMGEEEFLGHLLEIMAAGHDTSANMLSWSCHIMATRQDIQDRLRQEINTLGDDATFAEIDKLPYLEHFMKESMRLYPPATTYHRSADKDVVVEGVFIPKGTMVDICPAMLLSNPTIWGENVDEIDPTRWEAERLSGDQLNPYAFTAFSNGPRICIGRLFAMFEIKLFLFEMIRNFHFIDVAKPFQVENPGFTLRPAGMEIRIEKIR
ncbi:hypothetical protein N0V93_004066 [Gnomoniopsis smithogilvyi]|uniref:Cytochrome P450 n=1 Tax=Gnomoniopsis smithogilvyi TaxID=1191159 RepID=A0A9W8YZX0_9PEZI|nr:hypothetical protein N0V93_004066 [Gnomoniopsis smithogilvyi]